MAMWLCLAVFGQRGWRRLGLCEVQGPYSPCIPRTVWTQDFTKPIQSLQALEKSLSFNRTFAKSWKLLTVGQIKAWVLECPWKLRLSYSVSWVLRVLLWVSLIILFLTHKSWLKNNCLFFFFFFPPWLIHAVPFLSFLVQPETVINVHTASSCESWFGSSYLFVFGAFLFVCLLLCLISLGPWGEEK